MLRSLSFLIVIFLGAPNTWAQLTYRGPEQIKSNPKSQSDDDDDEDFRDVGCSKQDRLVEGMNLRCVSCGLEKLTKAKVSPKFLALLGTATWKYENLGSDQKGNRVRHESSARGGEANVLRLKHIILKLQAYGFCTRYANNDDRDKGNDIYSLKLRANSGSTSRHTVTNENSKVIENGTGLTPEEEKDLARHFGVDNMSDIGYIFKDPALLSTDFHQRQRAFRERASKSSQYHRANGENLKDCLAEAERNINSIDSYRPSLCRDLAEECGIKSRFCTDPTAMLPSNDRGPGLDDLKSVSGAR